jgi:hypothetical protein
MLGCASGLELCVWGFPFWSEMCSPLHAWQFCLISGTKAMGFSRTGISLMSSSGLLKVNMAGNARDSTFDCTERINSRYQLRRHLNDGYSVCGGNFRDFLRQALCPLSAPDDARMSRDMRTLDIPIQLFD